VEVESLVPAKNVEAIGESRRGRGGGVSVVVVGVGLAEFCEYRRGRRIDKLGRIRRDCGIVVVERVGRSCQRGLAARC
jgi:hypothetical protein